METQYIFRADEYLDGFLNKNFPRKDKKITDGKINVAILNDIDKSFVGKEYLDALGKEGLKMEQINKLHTFLLKPTPEGHSQGWITLDEFNEFFIRIGAGLELINLIKKAQQGGILTPNEILSLGIVRIQYSGPLYYPGLFVPANHNCTLYPLIPQLCKDNNLNKLFAKMTMEQIGYVLHKSGSISGSILNKDGHFNELYDQAGNISQAEWAKQIIYYQYLISFPLRLVFS